MEQGPPAKPVACDVNQASGPAQRLGGLPGLSRRYSQKARLTDQSTIGIAVGQIGLLASISVVR